MSWKPCVRNNIPGRLPVPSIHLRGRAVLDTFLPAIVPQLSSRRAGRLARGSGNNCPMISVPYFSCMVSVSILPVLFGVSEE